MVGIVVSSGAFSTVKVVLSIFGPEPAGMAKSTFNPKNNNGDHVPLSRPTKGIS